MYKPSAKSMRVWTLTGNRRGVLSLGVMQDGRIRSNERPGNLDWLIVRGA